MAACFSPSATVTAASRVPSASVTAASEALGGHLAVHGVLNVARRLHLANLHLCNLDAPTLGNLIQLLAQLLVDAVPLGQYLVERDLPDYRSERCGGYADHRAAVVDNLDDRLFRVSLHDSHVDQEVDVDGRVVPRDVGLARDVDHHLTQVDSLVGVERPEHKLQARRFQP
jgi:hypothetical protein